MARNPCPSTHKEKFKHSGAYQRSKWAHPTLKELNLIIHRAYHETVAYNTGANKKAEPD